MKQVIQRDVIVGGEYLAGELRKRQEWAFDSTLDEIIHEINIIDTDVYLANKYFSEKEWAEASLWGSLVRSDWQRLHEMFPSSWISAAFRVIELRQTNAGEK